MKVSTRTRYKLVGSDYSAQEPRITTFLGGDPAMRAAYLEGKDLYCVIAANIYNNDYWDNTEFYKEGTVIELDGRKTIAGNDKTYTKQVTDKLEVPYYYLVPTEQGDIKADEICVGAKILAAEGAFEVASVETTDGITNIYFKD